MFQYTIQRILNKKTNYSNEIALEREILKNLNSPYQEGKLLRSTLLYAFSGDISKLHCQTAASIELIHTASIIHDDIVDSNLKRRGLDSFLRTYGEKMSVLKGDLLLIKALKYFIKIHNQDKTPIQYLLRECYSTAYGATLEQELNNSLNPTIEEYIRIAYLKTAPLFKLSAFLGAYISNKPFEKCIQAAIFGLYFGAIFQIQNDLDSYKFEKFSESEDYIQKNITFPIILMHSIGLYDLKEFKRTSTQNQYEYIQNYIKSSDFRKKTMEINNRFIQSKTLESSLDLFNIINN